MKNLLPYLCLIILFLSGCAGENEWRFVVFGNSRPDGATEPQPHVFRKIIKNIENESPFLVINVGDIIWGSSDLACTKKQMREFYRVFNTLKIPKYIAVGEHEIAGSEENQNYFKKKLGGLYKTFTHKNCRFIILNSEEIGSESKIAGKQFLWLERVLSTNKKKHVFVFAHRPLFAVETSEGACFDSYPQDGAKLVELFNRYGVRYFIAGHERFYNRCENKGVIQYISGGAGAPLKVSEENGGFHHYLIVKVKDGNVDIQIKKVVF
ncbi:MAG: metallophosphoesterase [Candidatus Aureabacteria bacterium]|nr:metallophosphoesterase [Candidatus Auribacterota bacterium]